MTIQGIIYPYEMLSLANYPKDKMAGKRAPRYEFHMFDKKDLFKLAKIPMPFGKYKGCLLIDLPEPYLLWFADKGCPEGQLGELLKLALEIKINGLADLIEPLKNSPTIQ